MIARQRGRVETEHPVVVEELGQEPGRKARKGARIGRPYGRRLGDDQPLDEGRGEVLLLQPLTEREGLVVAFQEPSGRAMETVQVTHHAVEGGRGQVAAVGEQSGFGDLLAYSKPPTPSLTLKLISVACQPTPTAASRRSKLG